MSEKTKMNEIVLKVELIQEILNYLGSRPYTEVANLVQKLLSEAQRQQTEVADVPKAQ